ncbi:hypothetical protein [Gorillibacterium sp. sgz5001074]|uniref:hypothetical protein n=1 Tax=Gorillibacterium sp. sgz5001074 TaxID=3446695 RepID=UPI003F67830F
MNLQVAMVRRRKELASLYCIQKDQHDDLWAFGILAQIEELDREIEEAGRHRTGVVIPFPVHGKQNSPSRGRSPESCSKEK